MNNPLIAHKIFFTSGVGRHEKKLVSFDRALAGAGIPLFNHVAVSSIVPPRCEIISLEEGVKILLPKNKGSILFGVRAEASSNESGCITAAVSMGLPLNEDDCGYIAEFHGIHESMATGQMTAKNELEVSMREMTNFHGIKIKDTLDIRKSAVCQDGVWTTVIAAAILIFPCFE